MTPASGSPRSSPPRQVAAPSASHGSSPAATRHSTSQARWLARVDPPPKSVPVAIATPAARASRTLSSARAWRSRIRVRRSGSVKRSIEVVVAKLRHERKIASVETRAVPRAAISATTAASSSIPCSIESTPAATPTRAPARSPEWAVTLMPRACAAAITGTSSSADQGATPGLRPVQVELEQVGAVVELADREAQQLVGVVRLPRSGAGHRAGAVQPRPGCPDVREARTTPPPVAHAQAEGAQAPVDRVLHPRRPDVARPAHARRGHQARVALGDGEEPLGRIVDAIDPVGAAGQGQVAVAVDHARHERRAARVDDVGSARNLALVVARTDPCDHAVRNEDARAQPQTIRAPVGEGTVPVERRLSSGHPIGTDRRVRSRMLWPRLNVLPTPVVW